jgi:hypothetical protein
LFTISKAKSIPLDQIPRYSERKLQEKQKIDEEIAQADAMLQTKNVNIQAINEHVQLNEKLKEHSLSTADIDKLLNLLVNAKSHGFNGKEIAEKLRTIQELECKENKLKDKYKKLSKRISKYKDIVPLTEDIAAVGISQAAKYYKLPPLTAILRLIEDIKNMKR